MLFPGFVTLYKDKSNKIHLYFYPGIDNFNQYYYNSLDLSNCKVPYKQINHPDNAVEYIFPVRNIVKIDCTLISKYNDVERKTLYIKDSKVILHN